MSILDSNAMDGIAYNKNSELIMLISDHLDWSDEKTHLFALQSKLNAYIDFWEGRQYEAIYPGVQFHSSRIEIHMMYPPTPMCNKFLRVAEGQMKKLNIGIVLIDKDGNEVAFCE